MTFTNTNPVKMYVDTKTMTINNAASYIAKIGYKGYKQAIENNTLVFVGAYQCRQNFPYMTNAGVTRSLYGKEVVIMSNEQLCK